MSQPSYLPDVKYFIQDLSVEVVGYLPASMNDGREGFEFSIHDGNKEVAVAHFIEASQGSGDGTLYIVSSDEQKYPPVPSFLDKELCAEHFEERVLLALHDAQAHLMEEEGFSRYCCVDLVAAGIDDKDALRGEGKYSYEILSRDFSNDFPGWRAMVSYGDGKKADMFLYPEECIPSLMKEDGCTFAEDEYGVPRKWHPKDDIYVSMEHEPVRASLVLRQNPGTKDVMDAFRSLGETLVQKGVHPASVRACLHPAMPSRDEKKKLCR